MLLRRSLLAAGSLMAVDSTATSAPTSVVNATRAAPPLGAPGNMLFSGSSVEEQISSRERVLEAFRQSAVPDDQAGTARVLRFRRTISIHVVGPQTTETQQLLASQTARLLAHTGLTAVARDTGEDGQIVVLFVPRLTRDALTPQSELLRAFWGGRERDLAAARSAFATEVELPIVTETRSLVRWAADQNGYIRSALVVTESGPHDVSFTKRLRREFSRTFGIQGYGLDTGHSLFNLRSLAVDLTAVDIRLLRTLYDPALPPSMDRSTAIREVSRLLDQQRG